MSLHFFLTLIIGTICFFLFFKFIDSKTRFIVDESEVIYIVLANFSVSLIVSMALAGIFYYTTLNSFPYIQLLVK